jgi:outer membrane receptor protein involved in Fe transport
MLNTCPRAAFLALFFLALTQYVFPQVKLMGYVSEENNISLEYASIALYNQKDTLLVAGTISDENGAFCFEKVKKGQYFLRIKCIGYADYEYPGCSVNGEKKEILLDSIQMQRANVLVDYVEVKGSRKVVQQQLDKKVYVIGNDAEAGTANALEILKKSPSVSTDMEGNLSIRGNNDIVLLVDGRPQSAGGNSMLESIPASSIEKIEIITNPSAKYQSEGTGGIINILLKKSKKDNFNALVNAKWGTSSKELIDVNTLCNKGIFHFHGKVTYSDMGRYHQSWRTRTLYLDTIYHFRDDFKDRRYSNNDYIASIGSGISLDRFELFLNAKSGLFEMWRYKRGIQSQWNNEESNKLNTNSRNESLIHWRYYQYDVLFNLHSQDKKHNLQNAYYFSVDKGSDNFWYEGYLLDSQLNQSGSTEKTVSGQEGTLYYQQFKSDYSYNTDSLITLEAGIYLNATNRNHSYYSGEFDTIASEYEYFSEAGIESKIQQNIIAAYVNLKGEWNGLTYQAGIRYEYDNQDIQPNTDTVYGYVGKDLLPSFHVSYVFNDRTSLFASYSKRKRLPRHWQIVPAYFGYDKYISGYGNPALKPCYTDKAELGANIALGELKINGTIYFNDSRDEIALLHKQGEGLVTDRYFLNINKHTAFGLDLDAQFRFTKWLDLRIGTNLFSEIYVMNSNGFEINQHGNTIFSKGILNVKPFAKTTVQISQVYASRKYIAGRYYLPWYYTDISIEQSLIKDKLKISVKSADVFQTSCKSGAIWQYPDFDGSYANWEKNYILFGLTYNFNKYSYTDKTNNMKRGAL